MNRIFVFAIVVAVSLAMGMGGAVAPIAAQEDTTNDTDEVYPGDQGPNSPGDDDDQGDDRDDDGLEDAANETAVEDSSGEDEIVAEIDGNTRIVDWSYEPGMFTIVIDADEETEVSITEGGDYEEGAGGFNYREFEIDEGTNHVTMPVTDREGAGIAIATRRSLAQGGGVTLSIGQIEQNPFRHFGGESGLFSGIIMTSGLAALGAAYVVRSEESGVVKA